MRPAGAPPFEVMAGKIAPGIVMGYLQLGVILSAAALLFEVPMVGLTFSTLAKNQLQAMQMTFFFLLSILLSGFMFPFRGMPGWAQAIGEVFALTHILRIPLKRYRQTLD